MKTIFKTFSLVALMCAFVNLFAQGTGGANLPTQSTNLLLPAVQKVNATDDRVVKFAKLPELKNLTIDTGNAHEVHDDGTGKGCIIFPIIILKPRPEDRNAANYAFVFYNLKNWDDNQVVRCHTNGSRDSAGKPSATVDLLDAAGVKLVSYSYQGDDLRIVSGSTPTARSYGDCVDNNYSGAKGAFAGAAAGACLSANIFACAASAGYLAGTLLGCAIK